MSLQSDLIAESTDEYQLIHSHSFPSPAAWMVPVALALRLSVIPFVYSEWLSPYNLLHYEQGNVAPSLLAGHGFGSCLQSHQPSAIMTPIYPLILAALYRLFGVQTFSAVIATLALNCLFSSLACIPIFLITRRSFGPSAACYAGWAWALSPYGIYFSAEWAWSTHLLLLCLCWLLYLAQDLEQSSHIGLWAAFGGFAGFAGLTEPSILVVVPFLMCTAAVRRANSRHRWLLPTLVTSLCLAATISPWMIRNAVVFHRFVPMRDSFGLELLLGNHGDGAPLGAGFVKQGACDAAATEKDEEDVRAPRRLSMDRLLEF